MRLIPKSTGRFVLIGLIALAGAAAQEPLTLRQAIQMALKQNPEADLACATTQEAKAGAALARTQFLPQVRLTEDMSRGDDPVCVFGTKLRQERFTQADENALLAQDQEAEVRLRQISPLCARMIENSLEKDGAWPPVRQ